MKKRYQIFVSSTYKDLVKERLIVKKAILEMGHFPAGMEEFPALDKPQMEYIKELIDESSYYILILGGHLGSIDKETNKSFTYLEFEYAKEKKIPILAIIKKRGKNDIECSEQGEKRDKYLSFVTEAEQGRLCKYYTNKDELSGIVHLGMNKQIKEYPQLGWVREEIRRKRYDRDLLLRGDIIEEFHIGREIYDYADQFKEFSILSSITQKVCLKYGRDTQGAFKLILFFPGHDEGYNLYKYVEPEWFDKEDLLKDDVCMQISFAKLGNIDEILLFFSVGNLSYNLQTSIYRISNIGIKKIATIDGQEFMYIDYNIVVPIGSQGSSKEYAYIKGKIYELSSI